MAARSPQLTVLQVGSALYSWGGIERYVLYLTEGLRGRGHEVTAMCPPGSPLAERLSGPKLELGARGKHDLRAFAAYLRLFKERDFDVVHVHYNPDFLVAGIAARVRKQPLVILTRHVALPWSKAKVRMYGSLFDHIIPVSNAVVDKLELSGIPRIKLTVAKAGCPAPGSVQPVFNFSKKEFHVGFFGRLATEKGLNLIWEAARRTEGVRFHVFGSGPLLQELQARSKGFPIEVYGFRADVQECMASVDAVVIPSTWEEAFPYSALEAMSMGKPLLVSRSGGLPEMVQEGVTGLAFDRGSAADLALAVMRLRNHPGLVKEMGEKARAVHRAEYTVERMAERIEGVYLTQKAALPKIGSAD